MRAVLIDPEARTITEVSDTNWALRRMYEALTFDHRSPCDDVNSVHLGGRGDDVLWVDGEGFIRPERPAQVWRWDGYGGVLCGRGLILGLDGAGNTIHATLTLAEVAAHVSWTPAESSGRLTGPTTVGNRTHLGHPITGPSTLIARMRDAGLNVGDGWPSAEQVALFRAPGFAE